MTSIKATDRDPGVEPQRTQPGVVKASRQRQPPQQRQLTQCRQGSSWRPLHVQILYFEPRKIPIVVQKLLPCLLGQPASNSRRSCAIPLSAASAALCVPYICYTTD